MAAPRGLSNDDIETLRAAVGSGRRPKVVFTASAGQMAGQTGQITALGDPSDGDEWISVRFGKDKLEFAPTDLQLPGKTTGRRAPKPAAAPPAPAAEPSAPRATTVPAASSPVTAPAAAPVESRAVARPAAKRGRAKAPAELTVTLAWQDGEWSVAAQRGAKVLAKPTPVRAADALRMVGMLDAAAVTDAVADIVHAARTEAADRAETLRRELADLEARLAELPELP